MYYVLKQGQITPNIENEYVLKLIHFVAQYSKITNTVLFLIRILHHFFRFLLLSTCNVRMSEGTFCRVEVSQSYLLAHASEKLGAASQEYLKVAILQSICRVQKLTKALILGA